MLDLYELKQFTAFADLGTLSKVAEKFHISTPSVTRSMQNVEECFGVTLFSRSKNRIELNETGRFAVEYAKKLIDEAEQTVQQVQAYDLKLKTITIKSCAPAPLWELLKKINNAGTGMTVSSSICSNEEVIHAVKNRLCDIAVLPFEISEEGFETSRFMNENLFVCVPEGHAFAEYNQLSFEQINGFNFLLRSELGFWDTLCRTKMPASKFLVQTDDTVFNELVNSSSLPCFTTDYFPNRQVMYPGRINIPITDSEAKVNFYVAVRKGFFVNI